MYSDAVCGVQAKIAARIAVSPHQLDAELLIVLVRRIRHDEATPWRPDGTCGIGMPPSTKTLWRPYGGSERAWPACSHGKYLKLTGTRRKARASETWKPAVRAERIIPAPLSNSQFGKLCRKSFEWDTKPEKDCKTTKSWTFRGERASEDFSGHFTERVLFIN